MATQEAGSWLAPRSAFLCRGKEIWRIERCILPMISAKGWKDWEALGPNKSTKSGFRLGGWRTASEGKRRRKDLSASIPQRLHAALSSQSKVEAAMEEVAQVPQQPPLSRPRPPLVTPRLAMKLTAAVLLIGWLAVSGPALAGSAAASGGKPSLAHRLAGTLRSQSWSDEAIVFLTATLPVLELRGAIPLGRWMGIDPSLTLALAIIGNMVPVPLILLYLDKVTDALIARTKMAEKFFTWLFEHTRKKAGPVKEFKWLGLMLFVAVPLPGTGAWSGAIVAHLLGMPFWSGFTANFLGVAIAGAIVHTLCNLGIREALVAAVALFLVSIVMWGVIRSIQGALKRLKGQQ